MKQRSIFILLAITIMTGIQSCSVPDSSTVPPVESVLPVTASTEITPSPTQSSIEQKYSQALDLYKQGKYFESSVLLEGNTDANAASLREDAQKRMILAPVRINGKWGYIDNFNNVVIFPQFDDAKPFICGKAIVCLDHDWFLIDSSGTNVEDIQGAWDAVGPFIDGLACFEQLGQNGASLYGCIDTSGQVVFAASSSIPISFINGVALIRYKSVDYYLYTNGDLYSKESMATISLPNHQNDLYSTQWKNLIVGIQGSYTAGGITIFSEPKPDIPKLYGYVYTDGTYAVPPRFKDAGMFIDGLAPVCDVSGLWGFIDRSGDYVIGPVYEHAKRFSQGLAAVKSGGKYGYIDKTGKMRIKPQFHDVTIFREGLAGVQTINTQNYEGWGFIDKTGKIVIKPAFGFVDDSGFMGGYCIVSTQSKTDNSDKIRYGVIDKKGKWKIKAKYRGSPSCWPGGMLADMNYVLYNGTKGYIQYDTEMNNHGEIAGSVFNDRNPDFTGTFVFSDNGYRKKAFVCDIPDDNEEDQLFYIWTLIEQGVLSVGDLDYCQDEYRQGIALYSDGALYGYKDQNGNVVIKAMYQGAGPFGACTDEVLPPPAN